MPRHTHDCDCCTFLGEHGEYDLYHCMQGGDSPTVIARYGSEGDYKSGLIFSSVDGDLAEAKKRAIALNLKI